MGKLQPLYHWDSKASSQQMAWKVLGNLLKNILFLFQYSRKKTTTLLDEVESKVFAVIAGAPNDCFL